VFCIYLSTDSEFCPIQHKYIGIYNGGGKCLQRGTDWVFKLSSLSFVFKGLVQFEKPKHYVGTEFVSCICYCSYTVAHCKLSKYSDHFKVTCNQQIIKAWSNAMNPVKQSLVRLWSEFSMFRRLSVSLSAGNNTRFWENESSDILISW
jgi:hypothetical protein